jgi:sulfate adenylyltransferase subunit 1
MDISDTCEKPKTTNYKSSMDLLRFITAGSVDDGKSTLIGRLLYDSKNILIDQLEALERQTKNKESGSIDLALLTDGLRAEREQGITIDVAYRYFSTPKRKFIIADAPGHVQYTRNMITGASNANLIIILIDARQGVVEQTRRHSIIASLLKIPHVVVAINKMDLVEYSQNVYNDIVIDYSNVAAQLGINDVTYIPISALRGDNIVDKSDRIGWFEENLCLNFWKKSKLIMTSIIPIPASRCSLLSGPRPKTCMITVAMQVK